VSSRACALSHVTDESGRMRALPPTRVCVESQMLGVADARGVQGLVLKDNSERLE